jgi:hypothetical protein
MGERVTADEQAWYAAVFEAAPIPDDLRRNVVQPRRVWQQTFGSYPAARKAGREQLAICRMAGRPAFLGITRDEEPDPFEVLKTARDAAEGKPSPWPDDDDDAPGEPAGTDEVSRWS